MVTGAASGIGRALVERCLDARCTVWALDFDENGLQLLQKSHAASDRLHTKVVDVASREQVAVVAQEIITEAGHIDVVVNNAGVSLSQTVADSRIEDVDWLTAINFGGVRNGVDAFLPHMLRRRRGHIVNVSSIFGVIAWPTQSAYVAAKFAVRGFTETLAFELRGSGVGVHCVIPGGIQTNIVKNSRFYTDDRGNTDKDGMVAEFESIARTTPDAAARTIIQGVEKRRRRILIGADAHALDLLSRITPEHYQSVLATLSRFRPKRKPAAKRPQATRAIETVREQEEVRS